MDTFKKTIVKDDLPQPNTEEESREQKALTIAILLARRIDGRDWIRYPNANQEKFQSKMLRLARDILDIALPPRTP